MLIWRFVSIVILLLIAGIKFHQKQNQFRKLSQLEPIIQVSEKGCLGSMLVLPWVKKNPLKHDHIFFVYFPFWNMTHRLILICVPLMGHFPLVQKGFQKDFFGFREKHVQLTGQNLEWASLTKQGEQVGLFYPGVSCCR